MEMMGNAKRKVVEIKDNLRTHNFLEITGRNQVTDDYKGR
jgi:hypothetical protein